MFAALVFFALLAFSGLIDAQGIPGAPEPLVFAFDPRDGLRTTVAWNPRSFDPNRVRKIDFRQIGYVPPESTGVRTSVVQQTGEWTSFVDGPQDRTMSYYFIKPHFCDTYEFCVTVDRETDRNGGGVVFSNGLLQEQCRGISQIMGLPPVRVSNNTGDSRQRVARMFYTGGQVQVELQDEPTFDFWRSAIVRVIRANVKPESCRSVVPINVPEPFIDNTRRRITFDPQYAVEECTFRHQVTYDLSLPGEPCSLTHTTLMNESLAIRLSCRDIPGIPECSQVVATASSAGRMDSCYDCQARVKTEAVVETDELNNRRRRVRIEWYFDNPRRPTEFKVRVSKADIIGSFHQDREDEPYRDDQRWDNNFIMLDDFKDYRYTSPSYLVQVCAVYSQGCEPAWNREQKTPVRLQEFESQWKLQEQSGLYDRQQYLYRGAATALQAGVSLTFAFAVAIVLRQ